jgi:hypothetical protein
VRDQVSHPSHVTVLVCEPQRSNYVYIIWSRS